MAEATAGYNEKLTYLVYDVDGEEYRVLLPSQLDLLTRQMAIERTERDYNNLRAYVPEDLAKAEEDLKASPKDEELKVRVRYLKDRQALYVQQAYLSLQRQKADYDELADLAEAAPTGGAVRKEVETYRMREMSRRIRLRAEDEATELVGDETRMDPQERDSLLLERLAPKVYSLQSGDGKPGQDLPLDDVL